MARFYKTAEGEFLQDKMYQPPIEMMAKVIGNADQQILNNETALASLYDKLNAQGLAADKPRLQEIIGGYRSQIDEMASKIQQNPLDFRRETGNIRNLGRSISDNWGANGEVGAIQGNKAARDSFVKDYIERVKDKNGGYLQQDVDDATRLFDYQFNQKGGTGYQGPGKYNSYSTQNLNPFVDGNKIAEDAAKGWEADEQQNGYAYSDGMRINKGTNSSEIANPVEIQKGIVARMINDKPLMNYYQQQMQFYKESGGSIGMSPEAVQNSINSSAAIYASKYGYSKNKSTKDMDTDPIYMEGLRNANDLDKMYRQHELNKDLKKYEDDLSSIKEIGTSSRGAFMTSDDIKENNNTIISVYSELSNYLGIKTPIDSKGKLNSSLVRQEIYDFRDNAIKNNNKKDIEEAKKMLANFNYANSLFGKTTQEASWAKALNIMSSDKVISAKKDWENVTKDPGQLTNVKQDWNINGKKYKNLTFNEIYKSRPELFTDGTETIALKDIFNQGSIRPIINSRTDYSKNKMNMTWNVPGVNIESNVSWTNAGISEE